MTLEEYEKLDEKLKEIVLIDALKLYEIVQNNMITADMLELVAKRCTKYGYTEDDLRRLLMPVYRFKEC